MNPFTLIDVSSEKRICPIHGEYEAKKVKLSSLSKTFLILGCPLCEEERDKKFGTDRSEESIQELWNTGEVFGYHA